MVTTHICLDVEILEVERVLPDVNANDRHKSQKWVLIGRRRDFESFHLGIEGLAMEVICQIFIRNGWEKLASHPQPEPWTAAAAVLNCLIKSSRLPKVERMASLSRPSFKTPPFPFPAELGGARIFQKREWLM